MLEVTVLIGELSRGVCKERSRVRGGGAMATRFRFLSEGFARPIAPKGHYHDH